ncbi:MAG: hypothetical protein RLZZ533_443 [Cyanobacteriota bacterium]
MAALKALLLGGWIGMALIGANVPVARGCSPVEGWQLQWEHALTRQGAAGETIGGFSAIAYEPLQQRIWLLSDLPKPELSLWGWPAPRSTPQLLQQRRITAPGNEALDGEGLLLTAHQLWMASEGRRTAERPALLLRVNRSDGRTLQTIPLPAEWQAGPGLGLASNAGPESLTRLSGAGERLELLMAAERPLLQDTNNQVRLLRWWWPAGGTTSAAPQASPQGWLQLPEPEEGASPWSLTDLLALPRATGKATTLLALLRRFSPPHQWDNLLALYALPQAGTVARPLQLWNLQTAGLTPENWEGLTFGPPQHHGGISLLLVSDDNLNPLQSSRLALLTPKPPQACLEQP